MRVIIDLTPAVQRHAGLGRYAEEMARALVALQSGDEVRLFYTDPLGRMPAPPLDALPRKAMRWPNKPWRMSALLSSYTRVPMDSLLDDADIFHATDHLLPHLQRIRSVFTLHDLIFLKYPETHLPLNRWFLRLMMPRFLRAADAVIAISECTKRDAVSAYELHPERIHVIYEGISASYRPQSPEVIAKARARYGLPQHYILYVGTIEPRKNLTTLLKAHQTLKGQGLESKLVIVGKKGWLYQDFFRRLRELGLEGQVIFPGYVPDDDLPAIYSAAQVFAFPSLYEGFGLPVLEAMACGTPVVCSNTSSLPEVAGQAALTIDPCQPRELAQALQRVLEDAALRAELRGKGLGQAARFSWERAARETLRVYESVCQGVRSSPKT